MRLLTSWSRSPFVWGFGLIALAFFVLAWTVDQELVWLGFAFLALEFGFAAREKKRRSG